MNQGLSLEQAPRGVLLYISHIGMCCPRVWSLRYFGLKMGIDFAHFGLELVMVFDETTGTVWTYVSFQLQNMNKKEREICECEVDVKKPFFLRRLATSWPDEFVREVRKRVWILEARAENGCEIWHFLVWNRVRIWRARQHTSTKNSQEYPPPPPWKKQLSHFAYLGLSFSWPSYNFVKRWLAWPFPNGQVRPSSDTTPLMCRT